MVHFRWIVLSRRRLLAGIGASACGVQSPLRAEACRRALTVAVMSGDM